MEDEQETIIIEVNNDDWQEGEEGSYHEYHVTELDYDDPQPKHHHYHQHQQGEKEGTEMMVEYTEGEGAEVVASYTEEVSEERTQKMGAPIVTYENIPAKGEIYVNTVQDGEVIVHTNAESPHTTYRSGAHGSTSIADAHMYRVDAQDGMNIEDAHTYITEESDHPHQQQHKVEPGTPPQQQQKQFDYSCPYCPMKYLNKTLLNAHVWIHPQHLPFTCRICNTSFRNKAEVDQHAQRHFNARNFFCRPCWMSLSCKASCIRHMKKVHGVDDDNIDLFMLKEVATDGKMMLVIRTVRNNKVYKRKFTLIKEQ
ncbi:hypothetical protein Pcinc_027998 [Petrolisthes cinctipes]|uniref:C2H2-type domain-containing protein n=1 Tax=Petrolisthes cinctipes TaxID=88211 RepID=A0AAE1F3A6_PETCI|nr:hypothetical protein Pcinc_027998 [Petrolisthes cinctipes]